VREREEAPDELSAIGMAAAGRRSNMKLLALGVLGVGLPFAVVGTGAITSVGDKEEPNAHALADIPPNHLALFRSSAATCPGLSWTIPAAIGKVESDFGRSHLPGVHSGMNSAGAAGPMQMGIGGRAGPTFYAYDHPVPADMAPTPPGGSTPPSPYDSTDAIYAAARYLCTNGAGNPPTVRQAIWNYNHSDAYVDRVLRLSVSYAAVPASLSTTTGAAIAFALNQLGLPYVWGGEGGDGFDCSGLVQAAYASGGIALPRVAQAQFDQGPKLPWGTELQPGDLVFFGRSSTEVTHVGLFLGDGQMVDAPRTGAVVRVEQYRRSNYVGATRPVTGGPPFAVNYSASTDRTDASQGQYPSWRR
jgi:cell wall-associated NlpC family hydrolase